MMVRAMSDEVIIEKYQAINQTINQLGNRLIAKLAKYGIEKNNESFTNLIHSINEIKAHEKYYTNNTKPTEPNLVPITYDGEYHCNKSLIEYNDSLIQKIVYYIKLLKYYLALKGVDLNNVNNTNTVAGLIELIDFIDAILETTFQLGRVKNEYYADEDIEIPFKIIDSQNNIVEEGEIDIYDGDTLLPTISLYDTIYLRLKAGEHNLTFKYKGTSKYKPSEASCSITVKPGRITLDTVMANQTESSLYYRSADTGYINDKWYIKIITKDTQGNILPNVPLIITDVLYEDKEVINENIIANNAISDANGVCIIQNISLDEYGNHTILIDTQYNSNDISEANDKYPVNIVHDFYYIDNMNRIYYEGQTQKPIVIELHNEDGVKPYEDGNYLYDDMTVSVTIVNILNDEVVLSTDKIVSNGEIVINTNLPLGYFHILLDSVIDLSINYADIHFNIVEHTVFLDALSFNVDGVIDLTNPVIEQESNEETDKVISGLSDEEDNYETKKYHVYGKAIVDVRENLHLIKNATDNSGNINLTTTEILSAINNDDTNFIKSLTMSDNIISSESIIRDNNKTIEANLEEAIGKLYLNDDNNIEYATVGDIYSLDNRKLQYNKQQG